MQFKVDSRFFEEVNSGNIALIYLKVLDCQFKKCKKFLEISFQRYF